MNLKIDNNMELIVLSPEKEFFKGSVKSVTVPGTAGEFEVLENHAPLISSLSNGEVKIKNLNGDISVFQIEGGFIEIIENELAILAQNVKSVN
ncbi:MAG: ATP synthase F1 subunit epsilon [Saprospiraceae bacterium]